MPNSDRYLWPPEKNHLTRQYRELLPTKEQHQQLLAICPYQTELYNHLRDALVDSVAGYTSNRNALGRLAPRGDLIWIINSLAFPFTPDAIQLHFETQLEFFPFAVLHQTVDWVYRDFYQALGRGNPDRSHLKDALPPMRRLTDIPRLEVYQQYSQTIDADQVKLKLIDMSTIQIYELGIFRIERPLNNNPTHIDNFKLSWKDAKWRLVVDTFSNNFNRNQQLKNREYQRLTRLAERHGASLANAAKRLDANLHSFSDIPATVARSDNARLSLNTTRIDRKSAITSNNQPVFPVDDATRVSTHEDRCVETIDQNDTGGVMTWPEGLGLSKVGASVHKPYAERVAERYGSRWKDARKS